LLAKDQARQQEEQGKEQARQHQEAQQEWEEQWHTMQEQWHAMQMQLSETQAKLQSAESREMVSIETQRQVKPLPNKLEEKLREQLAKKDRLVRALRDAVKQLGALGKLRIDLLKKHHRKKKHLEILFLPHCWGSGRVKVPCNARRASECMHAPGKDIQL
jgi:hypothetical protein